MGRRCCRALLIAALVMSFPAANKGTLLPLETMSRHSGFTLDPGSGYDLWPMDMLSLPQDPPGETSPGCVEQRWVPGRVRRPEWHRRRRESWDAMFNLLLRLPPDPAPLQPVVARSYSLTPGAGQSLTGQKE